MRFFSDRIQADSSDSRVPLGDAAQFRFIESTNVNAYSPSLVLEARGGDAFSAALPRVETIVSAMMAATTDATKADRPVWQNGPRSYSNRQQQISLQSSHPNTPEEISDE